MVLNYSVNLYFPQEKCAEVLRSVAALAGENDADVVELRAACRLPDGSSIRLPFTSRSESKNIELRNEGAPIRLDTALLFPVDGFLEAYVDAGSSRKSRDGTHAFVGYLDLTISLDTDFCEFSFEARASSMSLLVIDSPLVRAGFNALLEAHDGLFGFIDTEGPGDPSSRLMNPIEKLPINRLGYGDADFDIDGFVSDVRSLEESQ